MANLQDHQARARRRPVSVAGGQVGLGGPMDRRADLRRRLPHGRAGRRRGADPRPLRPRRRRLPPTSSSWRESDGARWSARHEMSIYLGGRGIEAVGMNKGGTFEAAGIGFTMVHAEHSGAVTLTGGETQLTPRPRLLGLGASSSRTAPASTTPATPTCSATWRWSASAGRRRSRSCRSAGTTRWVRATPGRAVGPDRRHDRDPRALRHVPDPGRHARRAGAPKHRLRWLRWSRARHGRHDMSLILRNPGRAAGQPVRLGCEGGRRHGPSPVGGRADARRDEPQRLPDRRRGRRVVGLWRARGRPSGWAP